MDEDGLRSMLRSDKLWTGPRSVLESDERFCQIVSYVIIRQNNSLLTYRRSPAAGEDRLHGKLSCGIGGHVGAEDLCLSRCEIDGLATVFRAADREVFEELSAPNPKKKGILGVLWDDANPVGRVHVGIVAIWDFAHDDLISSIDPGIADVGFMEPDLIVKNSVNAETWSTFVVTHLSNEIHVRR